MASGKYQTFCTDIFNHFLRGSSETVATAADVRIALVTTTPSSTALGTELVATNYSAGGTAVGFGTSVEGNPTEVDNDAQIQWTAGGSAWTTITGAVVHRGGTTLALATAMYFIDGLSISVPALATLTIAAGDCSVTEA